MHDQALLPRRLVLLALPWVFSFVPVRRPKEGLLAASLRLQAAVQDLVSTSQMLRLMSQAIPRDPRLQRKSTEFWSNVKFESNAAQDDAEINEMARRLGIDISEGGELREQTMGRIKDYFRQMDKKRRKT